MSTASSFASDLLAELRRRDPLAQGLVSRSRGKAAVIGIVDEGDFVPLLRLDAGSAAFNKMSLFVHHRRSWEPTFLAGTPAMLAEPLAGELRYLWAMAAEMAEPPPDPGKKDPV
jgi:hypothetical protein